MPGRQPSPSPHPGFDRAFFGGEGEPQIGGAGVEVEVVDVIVADFLKALAVGEGEGLALAGDQASMDRVEARYGAAMARTEHASAFSLVANETVRPGDARLSALVAELADLDDSASLMRGFRAAELEEETG